MDISSNSADLLIKTTESCYSDTLYSPPTLPSWQVIVTLCRCNTANSNHYDDVASKSIALTSVTFHLVRDPTLLKLLSFRSVICFSLLSHVLTFTVPTCIISLMTETKNLRYRRLTVGTGSSCWGCSSVVGCSAGASSAMAQIYKLNIIRTLSLKVCRNTYNKTWQTRCWTKLLN